MAGFVFAAWSSYTHVGAHRLAYSVTGSYPIGMGNTADSEAGPASDQNVAVIYQGRSLPRLTATTICVVNLGTGSLQPGDFEGSAPITFDFGEKVTVLHAAASGSTPKNLAAHVRSDNRTVSIDPLTMNRGGKLAFVVLSDGSPRDTMSPMVSTPLVGGWQIERVDPITVLRPWYLSLRCASAACLALPCLLPLLAGWIRFHRLLAANSMTAREKAYSVLLVSVMATLALAAVDVMAWRWLDRIAILLDGLSRLYAS